ncbi:hypothetical protein EDC01DRAFT_659660 [Geopyxis carbonaria]|nr:hypothetical protein EDC01DRAFT_659660 [Geopyxis carbonaria]
MNMAPPPVKVSQISGPPPCCQPDMRHTVPLERSLVSSNPRHSTGSLVLGQSPPRFATGPPSPTDSDCSCDSSLPLNTPWSSPPTSNSGSMVSRSRSRRRSSVADAPRPILRGGRAPSPSRPLVVQRAPSPIRSERTTTARTVIVPASSGSASSHRSSSSRSYAKYSSSARSERSTRAYYDAYAKSVDVVNDQQAGHDFPRPGRTKFPRKLVDREAVEEMNYPYTIEDGCVVVMQALGRPEIEALVDLTEELRRRGEKKRERKAVSFYEKTIVHEALPIPIAPTPPASDTMSIASHTEYPQRTTTYHPRAPSHLTQSNVSHLNSGPILVPASSNPSARARSVYNPASSRSSGTIIVPASSSGSSRSRSVYNPAGPTYMSGALPPPTFEPLSPPGPGTPKPTVKKIEFETPAIPIPVGKTAEEKIAKVEEKAIKADKIAAAKEHKALRTGRAKDEHEAWKARNKAEDLVKKLEEKERKERLKHEERELKERAERERTMRIGRNRRGEVVVIKG